MAKRQRVGARTAASNFTAPQQVDITQWVTVDEAALSPERLGQFRNRKRAIELYLDGANDAHLFQENGLKRRNVYRLIVERCLLQSDDGTLLGWRGRCLFIEPSSTRVTRRPRSANGEMVPLALQWIFSSKSGQDLEARFRRHILLKAPPLAAAKQPRQSLFGPSVRFVQTRPLRPNLTLATSSELASSQASGWLGSHQIA